MRLSELLPNAADLLRLEPEELGGVLLRGLVSSFGTERFKRGNFFNPHDPALLQDYPGDQGEPVESMNGVRFSGACEIQFLIRLSGPLSAAKFDVLSTWMPASCAPLKGVTASAQPAFSASTGESNHTPR
jgi:hypothetical protein